jgi:hypothetical protein
MAHIAKVFDSYDFQRKRRSYWTYFTFLGKVIEKCGESKLFNNKIKFINNFATFIHNLRKVKRKF